MTSNHFLGRYAALLLSRQHLRPNRRSTWVCAAREAVDWVRTLGFGVTSSIGMQTWEMVTTIALGAGLPLRLVVPSTSAEEYDAHCQFARGQFDINSRNVTFIPACGENTEVDSKRIQLLRDHAVIDHSDLLLPLSVRPRGNMARLISRAEASGKVVERRFDSGPPQEGQLSRFEIETNSINPEIDLIGCDYLIHWTRATNGAWPGEKLVELYHKVLRSDMWPHDGFATLRHIIEERRIRATSDNMPDGIDSVSFSDLAPRAVLPLMTWRARYNRMAFEPYGIGIRKISRPAGMIHPVIYYDPKKGKAPDRENYWRSQSIGRVTDWRGEHEYRHRGDVHLADIEDVDIVVICGTADEAKILRRTTSYRIIAMQLHA